nr:MAG TPA: Repressor protein CI [Caudoviricetes sp.]
MKIGDVILKIRKENNYTFEEIGDKLKVSKGLINDIEKDKKKVSKNMYEKLIKAFPLYKKDLEIAYTEQELLMLPESIKENLTSATKKTATSNLKGEQKIDYVVLPLYGMASAGSGQINYMEDKIEKIKIPKIFGNPKKEDFVTKVNGDSMEPKYSNGDLILVRTSDFIDIREMNNKEAVVDIAEERFLKKVEFEEGTGVLRLKSYNTAYADIVVEPRELEVVRVIGTIGMIIKQFQH